MGIRESKVEEHDGQLQHLSKRQHYQFLWGKRVGRISRDGQKSKIEMVVKKHGHVDLFRLHFAGINE